jgi:thymidylate synthase ThyX
MRDLSELTHHSTPLSSGGEIVVLDTGSLIGPESQAMLGALHSRSPGGIRSHLEVLAKRGSDNFMANFYVGYGHKSIGDLGSVAVFIESVSMLAAKAIQDFPLYNGQEVSTRYVDFSKQAFIDPVNTPASNAILEEWRRFYLHGLAELIPALEKRFPRSEEELEKTYDKAIKARAFDTMRAFLPAAASTNLVCVSTLRQYADRMPAWRNHPLSEVQEIGTAIEKTLLEAFPNSFSDMRKPRSTMSLAKRIMPISMIGTRVSFDSFQMTYTETSLLSMLKSLRLAHLEGSCHLLSASAEARNLNSFSTLDHFAISSATAQ